MEAHKMVSTMTERADLLAKKLNHIEEMVTLMRKALRTGVYPNLPIDLLDTITVAMFQYQSLIDLNGLVKDMTEGEANFETARSRGMQDGAREANAAITSNENIHEDVQNVPMGRDHIEVLARTSCNFTQWFLGEVYVKTFVDTYLAVVRARCEI